VYTVDRVRDGRSFTTRRVSAIQHGETIFSMSASFQTDQEGVHHQDAMPQAPQLIGSSQQGGINVYSRQLDEHLVTVLGETPGATVRQIAFSVAHR